MSAPISSIINLLYKDGVTTDYVAEQLNVTKKEAAKILRDAGAFYNSRCKRWRLQNLARREKSDKMFNYLSRYN